VDLAREYLFAHRTIPAVRAFCYPNVMNEPKPADIRRDALNLLARREHLRSELAGKLLKRFGRRAEVHIEETLDRLCDEKLLSDERFVEAYIRQRARRGCGPDRIRGELRRKGVSSDLVNLTFDVCDEDWLGLAREVRRKKFGPGPPADFKEQGRQMRFLHYRGFGAELAARALRED